MRASISHPIDTNARLGDLNGNKLTGAELVSVTEAVSACLSAQLPRGSLVGLYADNSRDWAIADLALQQAGMVSIPVPGFFTLAQIGQLLMTYQVQAVIAPMLPPALQTVGFAEKTRLPESSLILCINGVPAAPVHPFLPGAKLTFTSGSTGDPKGIPLGADQQWQVADSLAKALQPLGLKRHLAMLPMSVLLENVAGLYTGLRLGADIVLPSMSQVGLSGSSGFNAKQAIEAIIASEAESIILLPQMLRDILFEMQASGQSVRRLKFVAVGGGKVADSLIREARQTGLPVYEGYGLSEACSVVSLNTPAADRIGSVGKPLAHQSVRIASDGEIEISQHEDTWFATGDLGEIDVDGFLHVTGRKKNVLITSFGRNVSPEWPESVLQSFPEIAQVMVYGEAQPHLCALIVPSHPDLSVQKLQAVIDSANRLLPDYARIGRWHALDKAFSVGDGLLTANGRPRREQICDFYHDLIQI